MDISSSKNVAGTRHQLTGVLYKYTNVMKGWQHRWFSVDPQSGTFSYYLCEAGPGDVMSPLGSVPRAEVHLAAAVICPSDEDSKSFTINCASGDILKLRAEDARARQEWVDGLRAIAESHTKKILLEAAECMFCKKHFKRLGGTTNSLRRHMANRHISASKHRTPSASSNTKKSKAIGANCPSLPPREQLAVLDALGCARQQLQQTELSDAALARAIESCSPPFSDTDPDLLLLKATSAASTHCLLQCLGLLQRQRQQYQYSNTEPGMP